MAFSFVGLKQAPEGAQCLRASTFSSFSKCFGNRFFCIFCKPHTYSHPFLPTLVSYKKIWPIYGFVHFSVTKKRAKLGSNLKQLINENFRFPSSIYDFFLLNTSHSEDMRQKNPNQHWKKQISVHFCAEKIPNFMPFFRIQARHSSAQGLGDISCNKYSKQTPIIISSYGETQANSYFSRNRNPKLTRLVICHFFHPYQHLVEGSMTS